MSDRMTLILHLWLLAIVTFTGYALVTRWTDLLIAQIVNALVVQAFALLHVAAWRADQ